MEKFFKFKQKKAQQLVEFMLVAPFIIIILGILLEYAYALNINYTLSNGLKNVTTSLYGNIKPNQSSNGIDTDLQNLLLIYFNQNNIPAKTVNSLDVNHVTIGDTTVFIATYKYFPAFTLPNIYFHFLPEEFNFTATSAVPTAFLNSNSAYDLDMTLSGEAELEAAKKSIISNLTLLDSVFLVKAATPLGSDSTYAIFKIEGGSLTPKNVLNTSDGQIYQCNATTCNSLGSFKGSYPNNALIFVHDDTIPATTDFSMVPGLFDSNVVVRSVSMTESDGSLGRGNFDNIDVYYFNPDASNRTLYKAEYFSGGKVVLYDPSQDVISNVK